MEEEGRKRGEVRTVSDLEVWISASSMSSIIICSEAGTSPSQRTSAVVNEAYAERCRCAAVSVPPCPSMRHAKMWSCAGERDRGVGRGVR